MTNTTITKPLLNSLQDIVIYYTQINKIDVCWLCQKLVKENLFTECTYTVFITKILYL